MAAPIGTRLPELTGVTQTSGSVASGVAGVAALGAPGGAGGVLGPLTDLLEGVNSRLNIDVSGLTDRFPRTLGTIQNAVAGGTMDFIGSLPGHFGGAVQLLDNTPLVQAARASSLSEVALAAVGGVLGSFEQSHADLARRLIDPATLLTVRDTLDAFEDFRRDFAAHRADFLPFLSRTLLGVAPDLLDAPVAHIDRARAVLSAIDPAALAAALETPTASLATVMRDVQTSVLSFDPADAAAYAHLDGLLQTASAAIESVNSAAETLYSTLDAAFSSHAWDTILDTLRTLLDAVPLQSIPSLDDLTDGVSNILQGVLTRLETALSPPDIAERIEHFTTTIRESLQQSPLGQIRRVIRDFLGQIRDAIDSIPTGEIQDAVEAMLGRIQSEVDSLGLSQIGDTIERGFRDLETFINSSINDTLRSRVREALGTLLSTLETLPVQTLAANLSQIVSQVQSLVDELEGALQTGFDQIADAVAQLDQLSFKPVGDAVVSQIDEVKARLAAINPNALSDVEKLAIKAAVAVLEDIDLDGFVRDQVSNVFAEGKDRLLQVVDEVEAALHTLRDRVAGFDPQRLVTAVTGVLDEATRVVSSLDGRALLRPLYDQLDQFARQLEAFSPGSLLDPLSQPFAQALAKVNELEPARLVEPLGALYAELDRLLGFVDVSPLMDELDRRQRALFTTARQAILSAIDGLSLPEPLAGFFATLRPVMEALTEALFGDPESELRRVSLDIATRVRLGTLFEPLDRIFADLVGLLESAPQQEIVDAFNALRVSIGVGLDVLDPRRIIDFLQSGLVRLQEIGPTRLLALPLRLPALKVAFEGRAATAPAELQGTVASVTARFEATITLVDPAAPASLIRALDTAHADLVETLRARLNALAGAPGASAVEASYGRLRTQLDRVLPAFLRSQAPIVFADIIEGVNTLRPSRRAAELEAMITRFLARLKPIEGGLEPAMNGVFASVREAVSLLSPLSAKDAVADIYAAIRSKYRILDPQRLATELGSLFDPLKLAVNAINPAALRARLDVAFHSVTQTLASALRSLLDEVVGIINEQLRALRDALATIGQQLTDVVETAARTFQEIIDRLEHLAFIEIIDRIRVLLKNLSGSFDKEIEHVRSSFREMIHAIPLGGSSPSASVAA